MKKPILLLIVFLTYQSQSSLYASNPISVESYNEIHDAKEAVNNSSLWSKAKIWIVKKWFKVGRGISIERLSSLSLFTGSLSLVSFGVYWLIAGFPELLIGALIAALIGIILSIVVLHKTNSQKSSLRWERRKAWFGLVFSLLTGLLPLSFFVLLLILWK